HDPDAGPFTLVEGSRVLFLLDGPDPGSSIAGAARTLVADLVAGDAGVPAGLPLAADLAAPLRELRAGFDGAGPRNRDRRTLRRRTGEHEARDQQRQVQQLPCAPVHHCLPSWSRLQRGPDAARPEVPGSRLTLAASSVPRA